MKTTIKKYLQNTLMVAALALGVAVVAPALQPTAYAIEGSCDTTSGIGNGINCAGQEQKDRGELFGTGSIFEKIVNIFLFIIGAVAVIMLIYGGFKYVTSGGDSSAVTSAKNTILYAVIGIVVALLAYAILSFVVTSVSPTA